jgi:hypothetical protein
MNLILFCSPAKKRKTSKMNFKPFSYNEAQTENVFKQSRVRSEYDFLLLIC